ncbi:cytochrome P450 [Clavulina sp. PMI_390]|nr:cytochrome P450 [Clavulina sp. PMI_390]
MQLQPSANSHLLPAIAGMNLIAGGETLVGVSRLFILAMILHPKVQKKAQEELDNVVGHDRLPTVDDIPNLPYLEAVIKEVFRWQPVAPISVPTLPRKTDYYQDYCIPTKTVVIHNIWALSRDEKMYPDADSFNPDRFLVDNPPRDPRLWSFGIGRRICPGIAYAEEVYTTLFMTLLATVNMMPVLDKDGKEPPNAPSVRTTGRPVNVLIPFSYRMHPRSDAAVALLHSSVSA